MMRFFRRRWFLLALGLALFAGFRYPTTLEPLAEWAPRNWIVALVMFTMAFPLDASSMWRAVRHPKATLLAIGLNFGVLPLLAWASTLNPLLNGQLAYGMLIAGAVPSTVASAAVWTRRAGGNDAIAIMVTMVTNLACFIVTPLWLYVTTGQSGADIAIDPQSMMLKLCLVVAVPVLAAQLFRLHQPLGKWAKDQKIPLGVVCQLGMLSMVFIGAIGSGKELQTSLGETREPAQQQAMDASAEAVAVPTSQAPPPPNMGALDWIVLIATVVTVHLITLALAHLLGSTIGVDRPDRIAAGFSGSQKTLLVGVQVAAEYASVFGGLALLPMVIFHVSQLLVDTFIADRLRSNNPEESASAPQSNS